MSTRTWRTVLGLMALSAWSCGGSGGGAGDPTGPDDEVSPVVSIQLALGELSPPGTTLPPGPITGTLRPRVGDTLLICGTTVRANGQTGTPGFRVFTSNAVVARVGGGNGSASVLSCGMIFIEAAGSATITLSYTQGASTVNASALIETTQA